jgi:hypothetical protein
MTVIGTNHTPPHTITVPLADVMAGAAKPYTLTAGGGDNHTHTLMVTAANFTALKTMGSVMVTSSNDSSHTHVVTLTC